MSFQDVFAEYQRSLAPDCWDPRWRQVDAAGGGMAVEYEVGMLLYGLMLALKPAVVVETGTHRGFSTVMIGGALQENRAGHLYSVDVEDYGVSALLARAGLQGVAEFIQGDSAQVITHLGTRVPSIDFLWLDADHSTEAVLGELAAATPLLKPGTYIALHDTIVDPAEALAVRAVRDAHPEWEYLHAVTARGFDLLRIPA